MRPRQDALLVITAPRGSATPVPRVDMELFMRALMPRVMANAMLAGECVRASVCCWQWYHTLVSYGKHVSSHVYNKSRLK